VLGLAECRRLLAVGAKHHLHGHLGIPVDRVPEATGGIGLGQGAPLVLPLNYALDDHFVVLRVGDSLFERLVGRLIAFEVDGIEGSSELGDRNERPWSVLVRGLALEGKEPLSATSTPVPEVERPGRHLVRIRADVVTGRRLGPRPHRPLNNASEKEADGEHPSL